MKKAIVVTLIVINLVLVGLVLLGTFNTGTVEAEDTGPFAGKIAVITMGVAQNEEEFRSAENLVAKYGLGKIIHHTWPDNFMAEQEQMITTVARLAADRDIKGLIINQAVPGTNPAVDRLLQVRNDVFIVYCQPQENVHEVARRANLILHTDDFARGEAIVRQADRQGARVFIHYSFPRHMANVMLAGRRDAMREEARILGMEFIDAIAPDPTAEAGITGTQQFIFDDVPRMVARHGPNTAFFGTNCAMQTPLIVRVMDQRAIYPEPCCPSPTHAFPTALGVATAGRETDIPFMVTEITRAIAAQGMQGRLSTWPAPASMVWTGASAEYIIRVLNGELPFDRVDVTALQRAISGYIRDFVGADVAVQIRNFPDPATGREIDNYKLVLMGHLAF
jgi:hypothetical protein